MKKIWVGTCGQVVAWQKFFQLFNALELNSTFYRFPTEKQIKNWQKYLAPAKEKGAFIAFKAHQLFTHPLRSPTWKRSEFRPDEREKFKGQVGCLKLNDLTQKYLAQTKGLSEALGADFILFQLPSGCQKEKENVIPFLEKAKEVLDSRLGLEIRWKDLELLTQVAALEILPVFDPFLEPELKAHFFPKLKFLYLRLHGTKDERGRINYKHQYSETELLTLKEEILRAQAEEIVVLFNNVYMKEDALRFKELLSK